MIESYADVQSSVALAAQNAQQGEIDDFVEFEVHGYVNFHDWVALALVLIGVVIPVNGRLSSTEDG